MNSNDKTDFVIQSSTMKVERMTSGTPDMEFIGGRYVLEKSKMMKYRKVGAPRNEFLQIMSNKNKFCTNM